jgi:alcohol dehydrogenase, propanol-preferring
MQAMVLRDAGKRLQLETVADPDPAPGQLLVRVEACGICRTDQHILDGDLKKPKLPLILGHEIVGRVVGTGAGVTGFATGMRVGVPWLGSTCGVCDYCEDGRENLCDDARFTGYDLDGGYAELCVADARYCFPLDETASAASLTPLMCAGLIGYRALQMVGEADRIGIYGFGAAAHLITQVALFEERLVYAFTRPGDVVTQIMARELGCVWTSSSDESPPDQLDAAIVFAPVGDLVPLALKAVRKGGTVVCGGIHMSAIPAFDYELLWGERTLCSVANLTREDAVAFLELARTIPIVAQTTVFPLHEANEALDHLRAGTITGTAVLAP